MDPVNVTAATGDLADASTTAWVPSDRTRRAIVRRGRIRYRSEVEGLFMGCCGDCHPGILTLPICKCAGYRGHFGRSSSNLYALLSRTTRRASMMGDTNGWQVRGDAFYSPAAAGWWISLIPG